MHTSSSSALIETSVSCSAAERVVNGVNAAIFIASGCPNNFGAIKNEQ